MNKKILTFVLLSFLLIGLVACQDQKTYNDKFTVIFYTGVDNSTVVTTNISTIFDVEEGTYIEKPEDPTGPGVEFLGWYKDKLYTETWDFSQDTIEESTVLYARWKVLLYSVSYIFDEAGGTFLDDPVLTYTVDKTAVLPKADRLGSLFLGWILTPISEYKVGDKIVKTTAGYSDDLVLYALFENKEYTVRFKSLLEGVSNPVTYTVEFASEMNFPVLNDTDTKHFVGWFSLDGTTTNEWGYQYINGEIFRGKALSYNEETNEWEFNPQSITIYAKWEDK